MKKLLLVLFLHIMLVVPAVSQSGSGQDRHPVNGVWKSMRERPALVGGTIRFDVINKTASFTWQGRGQLTYAIASVDYDDKVGARRYFLVLRGAAGTLDLTVIIHSDSTIYIGQGDTRSGIVLWGAYTRQG